MTTLGTCHFETFEKAVQYYKAYGFSRIEVGHKRALREIFIGPPSLAHGQSLAVNDEGRYVIHGRKA